MTRMIRLPRAGALVRVAAIQVLILALAPPRGVQAAPPATLRHVLAPANLALLAAGGLLAAAAYSVDDQVRDAMDGQSPFDVTADFTNVYGSSALNLPLSLGLWSAGRVSGRPGLRVAGAELSRTLLMTQLLVAPLKLAVGRERPDGSNHRSFPSGHSANSFAVARLMQLRRGWTIGAPLYGLAVLTAAGRLADDRHYFSDVVMGAAAGVAAANCTVWAGRPGRKAALAPFRGAWGLQIVWLQ